jgi:cytochrome c556
MVPRKLIALAVSAFAFSAFSVGLSFAQDEKKETLHELMEKVGSTNSKVNRTMQTKVRFTKANNGKDVVEPANLLLDLAKKAKQAEGVKEAIAKAKDEKEPQKKWDEFMAALTKGSEDLAKAADAGDYDKAKAAHTAIKASCADCHKVFNIEDDF